MNISVNTIGVCMMDSQDSAVMSNARGAQGKNNEHKQGKKDSKKK